MWRRHTLSIHALGSLLPSASLSPAHLEGQRGAARHGGRGAALHVRVDVVDSHRHRLGVGDGDLARHGSLVHGVSAGLLDLQVPRHVLCVLEWAAQPGQRTTSREAGGEAWPGGSKAVPGVRGGAAPRHMRTRNTAGSTTGRAQKALRHTHRRIAPEQGGNVVGERRRQLRCLEEAPGGGAGLHAGAVRCCLADIHGRYGGRGVAKLGLLGQQLEQAALVVVFVLFCVEMC